MLLRPLSDFDFSRYGTWLHTNLHYHRYGFSKIPSASIHAAMIDYIFAEAFEQLYHAVYVRECAGLPGHVAELMRWAEKHTRSGGAGGVSDMTFYFLLQSRSDEWARKTLGWVRPPARAPLCAAVPRQSERS